MEFKIKKKDRLPDLGITAYKVGTSDPHNFNDDGTIYDKKLVNGAEISDKKHVFFIMKKTQVSYTGSYPLTSERLNQGVETGDEPLSTSAYNIILSIDNFDPLLIDVTGDEGVGGNYEPSDIVDNINAAFANLDTSLANVASLTTEGYLKITSPSTGINSRVIVHNNPGEVSKNATEILFDVEEDSGTVYYQDDIPVNPNLFGHEGINAEIVSDDPSLGKLKYKWNVLDTQNEGIYIAEFKIKYVIDITLTGSIKFFNGSKTLEGINAKLLSEIKKGDFISDGSKLYMINKITNDNAAVLVDNYDSVDKTVSTPSGKGFKFRSFPSTDDTEKKLFVKVADDVDNDDDFYE